MVRKKGCLSDSCSARWDYISTSTLPPNGAVHNFCFLQLSVRYCCTKLLLCLGNGNLQCYTNFFGCPCGIMGKQMRKGVWIGLTLNRGCALLQCLCDHRVGFAAIDHVCSSVGKAQYQCWKSAYSVLTGVVQVGFESRFSFGVVLVVKLGRVQSNRMCCLGNYRSLGDIAIFNKYHLAKAAQ